ncbi:MAG: cobalt transporter, partial [Rhizobiales bacterium]|nr:cobalt transporter [Hyphomicrobiales bacterium]
MLQRILISAIGAGLAVGLVTAAIQHVTTTPLVIAAEAYEQPDTAHHHHPAEDAHAHSHADAEEHSQSTAVWAPGDGFERTFYTSLT